MSRKETALEWEIKKLKLMLWKMAQEHGFKTVSKCQVTDEDLELSGGIQIEYTAYATLQVTYPEHETTKAPKKSPKKRKTLFE